MLYVEAVASDPYRVLGVRPGVSNEDLHDAYRRLVKLHHPDRNGGSAESTRRFQEIQAAYDELRNGARPTPRPAPNVKVEDRMADLERELREAQAARERVRRAARQAAAPEAAPAPATTDDSFGKIVADVKDELSHKLSEARGHPAVKRVEDIIDGLEDLASRLDRL